MLHRSNLIISCRRHLSSIQRFRLQQKIKESDDVCAQYLPKAQFILYHRGKPFLQTKNRMDNQPQMATFQQVSNLIPSIDDEAVFLRLSKDQVPVFAVMLPKEADTAGIEGDFQGKFVDMRAALFMIRSDWSGLMSGGSSLLRWVKSAKYCWSCQAPLKRNASGCQLKCSNDACGSVFYPPTNPVGISLIAASDHSKALLIRQPMYPPGMYSCVAGFVDPGESLSECVTRECAEEAGVEVNASSLQLVDSNHWPNPTGSLMIGCIVTTDTETPSPCTHEIEAVKWFTPKELNEAVLVSQNNPALRFAKNHDPNVYFVPPKGAIANVIIRSWLKKYHQLS